MSAHENWLEEKKSAFIYRVLADVETGHRRKLFGDLALAAEEQAETWKKKFAPPEATANEEDWSFEPGPREKCVALMLRAMGPKWMRPALSAMKVRGLSVYSHAIEEGHDYPVDVSQIGARHKLSGHSSNIRAAVFGINDGLISNASLIVGVAAATHDAHVILISGTAGLFAGALSMAAGEFVSVTSQRELLEHQLSLEKAELEMYPEEEAAELALIYKARGIPSDQAEALSRQLISNPRQALDTLAREELGVDPNNLGSPLGAAISSFVAFAIGSVIPLIPFFLQTQLGALKISLTGTAVALFCTGIVVGFLSGRGLLWAGSRMVIIGGGAGLLSYFISYFFGSS